MRFRTVVRLGTLLHLQLMGMERWVALWILRINHGLESSWILWVVEMRVAGRGRLHRRGLLVGHLRLRCTSRCCDRRHHFRVNDDCVGPRAHTTRALRLLELLCRLDASICVRHTIAWIGALRVLLRKPLLLLLGLTHFESGVAHNCYS